MIIVLYEDSERIRGDDVAGGRGGALADGGHRWLVREGKARGRRERENDERIAKRGDKKRPKHTHYDDYSLPFFLVFSYE